MRAYLVLFPHPSILCLENNYRAFSRYGPDLQPQIGQNRELERRNGQVQMRRDGKGVVPMTFLIEVR